MQCNPKVISTSPRFPPDRIISYTRFSPHLPKLRLPTHILDILKLLPHLNHRVPNQPRIQTHRPPQRMLRLRTRIKAHDEVVSVVVCGLQLLRRLGEQERAPVGVPAHDAVLVEDYGAGCFRDSIWRR